ncbi:hypothetical protein RFI_30743 [Reticulomyxa filosa]|uniref:Uncharacterized protein n=1 Tax=Reticulomyxa filosa TaxID=46433 RepID=X6LYE2_RETFI|nr:hypothetical protein RFI_30743 [Reticulomyxa filosa]|eukprot:ETO06649.1 hypothetical protein RFI_30743 [Reticulomyxa filosa]
MVLLHGNPSQIKQHRLATTQLDSIFDYIVDKYQHVCLCVVYLYIYNIELLPPKTFQWPNFLQTMKYLKVRAQEAHKNLQVRGILVSRHSLRCESSCNGLQMTNFVLSMTLYAKYLIGKKIDLAHHFISCIFFKNIYVYEYLFCLKKKKNKIITHNPVLQDIIDMFVITFFFHFFFLFLCLKRFNYLLTQLLFDRLGNIARWKIPNSNNKHNNYLPNFVHSSDIMTHFWKKKYVELPKVRELDVAMVIITRFDVVEKRISNCCEMLFVAIRGAKSATGDDYLYLAINKKIKKNQDKYFIDGIAAMKAVRNFMHFIFGQAITSDPSTNASSTEQKASNRTHESEDQENGQASSSYFKYFCWV